MRVASSSMKVCEFEKLSIYSKKCKVFTFHETFLIFSGVLRKISQGPKCTSQIWIGLCFFLLISADAHWEGLHDEPIEYLRERLHVGQLHFNQTVLIRTGRN